MGARRGRAVRDHGACSSSKGLRIPYHNKADGFMAALVLTLNQVKFCELHGCQPHVQWGAFPACKYAGVRFPGRTPFFDKERGGNAFEYFFQPLCHGHPPAQEVSPMLSCEQREEVHRLLPWAVRTYYYGATENARPAHNDTYDVAWYASQRAEGARLVASYLRLQPYIAEKMAALSAMLIGDGNGATMAASMPASVPASSPHALRGTRPRRQLRTRSARGVRQRGPVLGVHLRGTDKGKYLATAGSGRAVRPAEYAPYVRAFLDAHGSNASVFVATDSPSYLAEVLASWPAGRIRHRSDVLRHEGNVAFAGAAAVRHTASANYRKGEEVLLDALLLSRCDYLLHSASGVAEFAIYWRPMLHKRSVHLQYAHGRQRPWWMPQHDLGHSDTAT